MSDTKVIEEETTTETQVEEVQQTEGQGWEQPAISISRSTSIGDHNEVVRFEVRDVSDFDSPGELAMVLKMALTWLAERDEAPGDPKVEMHFTPISGEAGEKLTSALRDVVLGARQEKAAADAAADRTAAGTGAQDDDTCPGGC